MRELTCRELHDVNGGASVLGTIWQVSLPARAVAGSAALGWAIGSAIYRTYDDEIQAGLDWLLN
ncbi:hypothetical protein EIM48_14500 [Pseudoxanthomonas sp. SGNA-20]|jgi:hypothetical protein|uniref:Uncharacterized protein n=1 Tax=Pseudoxanthomonas taiwanensis J19 TaxID=935569 RepID=A0A562DKD1_9GAMM|nr:MULTISPECIES: hypothetical protein [Pseudoxanthomonas]RRN53897.1 hypothetical protein EIM48_14500 [Pseudoxanthomonas sp. SGNA-20]RRN78292.1 hypothetical protein EIM50_14910 [Pseudoxanthomonas sp. SGD-10]TWH10132.1 hypothetical protein L613_000300000210 [Pseudoxanthomonas taiwanensis J19]